MVEKLLCDSEGQWQPVGRSYVRHMTVWDLVQGQKYQLRVAAENMFGKSHPGLESEPVTAAGSLVASADVNYDSLGRCNLLTYLFIY